MKKHKAFSLVELSIVILIIAVLIAGVAQSSRMIKQSRLRTAQSLTQTSPVNDIPNLVVWYETSLASSFNATEGQDGNVISTWYDNNPQALSKSNAIQATGTAQPKFFDNVFNNGIPGIRFDGIDDFVLANVATVDSSTLTYFVVAKRIAVTAHTATFVGVSNTDVNDSSTATSFNGFYEGPTGLLLEAYRNNAINSNATNPGNNIAYIASSVYDGTNNTVYLNGVAQPSVGSSGQFGFQKIYIGIRWESSTTMYPYNGNIAEIIIFSRRLKSEERRLVEGYLSKKYGIAVS